MNIKFGDGKTEYGPGVLIQLTGTEIAIAIHAYLTAHAVDINGPRTITVNGKLCDNAKIYIDPSGFVMYNGERWSGRGRIEP